MAYRLGLLPAAGSAARFHHVPKELLPFGSQEVLLQRAFRTLRSVCDDVVVVSNPQKIAQHAAVVPEALFVNQIDPSDIWGAMLAGMRIRADRYYFMMPDTVVPPDAFQENWVMKDEMKDDLAFGTFTTQTPERFGVFVNGTIVNKQAGLPIPATAWGVLVWNQAVRDHWLSGNYQTYTQALNGAMRRFSYAAFNLSYYYDLASFDDYVDAIQYWFGEKKA